MHSQYVAGLYLTKIPTTLFEMLTVGGERKYVEFEKDIVWMAKTETTLEFIHGGELLKNGSTFNDYYGYLTSVYYDQDSQQSQVDHYSVSKDSSLEIRLVTKLVIEPFIEKEEDKAWNHDADSRKVKYKLITLPVTYRTRTTGEKGTEYHLPCINIIDKSVTWSSKNTTEVNETIRQAYIEKWKKPEFLIQKLDGKLKELID